MRLLRNEEVDVNATERVNESECLKLQQVNGLNVVDTVEQFQLFNPFTTDNTLLCG